MTTAAQYKEKISTVSDLAAARQLMAQLAEYSLHLEGKIFLLTRKTFGRSSERYIDPNQLCLFNEVELLEDEFASDSPDNESEAAESVDVPAHTRKKRRPQIELPDNLERIETIHTLAEEERLCPCCQEAMAEMGEDICEKLHVIPATVKVRRDIYKKYSCTSCAEAPKQAERSPTIIPKIKASEETLAFIAVQKYVYSVPLYRLEYLFKNTGVVLSRYVMSLWMIKLAEALKPIYLSLEELLLSRNYLHMDETTLQVLREPGRAATTKSYVWVRTSNIINAHAPPIVLYHYSPSRQASVASELLGEFSGYLQTDDYAGYSCALKIRPDIKHVLCWDHARRYFWDAFQALRKDKRANTTADRVLKLIGKLYKIEERAKGLAEEDRLAIRQKEAVEILQKIHSLCAEKLPTLSPQAPTAVAIRYMFDNWEKLLVYTTDGKVNISNSPAEQRIRPFAVGRKNWLFANTPAGAEASSIIYSVIETAKLNGLNPTEYLTKALKLLATMKTTDDLAEILPLINTVH